MSFLRHREIYPSDGGKTLTGRAPAHRLDEFPTGYSLAGCSPAEPASASPASLILLRLHSFVYEVSANGNLSLVFVSHQRGAAQPNYPITKGSVRLVAVAAFVPNPSSLPPNPLHDRRVQPEPVRAVGQEP